MHDVSHYRRIEPKSMDRIEEVTDWADQNQLK